MMKTFNALAIIARCKRLGRVSDSDKIFNNMLDAAKSMGGSMPKFPHLAFTGIPDEALISIEREGLRAGVSRGMEPGPNSNVVWFKRGAPFYNDRLTLVIPAQRILDLGGEDTFGLAGQRDVMTLHHSKVPSGIPVNEFAIVYASIRGIVVPIYKAEGWSGAAGYEIGKLSSFRTPVP